MGLGKFAEALGMTPGEDSREDTLGELSEVSHTCACGSCLVKSYQKCVLSQDS